MVRTVDDHTSLEQAVVGPDSATYDQAAEIFERMCTQEEFAEFLTLPLYEEI